MLSKVETTSGLYTLSVGKVQSLEVPLPPLSAQHAVVERIRAELERTQLRCAVEAELSAVEALPSALLREAFGG